METNQNAGSVLLPSFSTLLKEAKDIYARKFKIFLEILIIPVAINFLVATSTEDKYNIFIFLATLLLYIAGIAVLYAIKDENTESDVAVLYKKAFQNLLPIIWITILTALAMALGFILLVIPAIIFAIWFAFSVYIYIDQGIKGIDALKKSKEYVKKIWWQVFWRIAVIGVFLAILSFVSSFFFSLFDTSSLEFAVYTALFNLLITPFSSVYIFKLYFSVKKATSSQVPIS